MRRPSTLTQSTLSYASSRTKQTEEERELFTCSSILETALIMVRDLFYFIVGAFGFDPTPRLPSRARGLAPSSPVPNAPDNAKSVKQHPPLPKSRLLFLLFYYKSYFIPLMLLSKFREEERESKRMKNEGMRLRNAKFINVILSLCDF